MMVKRAFNKEQLDALEAAFQQDPYLNTETRTSLTEFGLAAKQVKTWFQNTRFKRRKNGSDPRLDFDVILGTSTSTSQEDESVIDKNSKAAEEAEKKIVLQLLEEMIQKVDVEIGSV
uniref:Homeobox domain-containing protein n=1 Tax=Panagrolaimus superbus TaxID=310955 RepID=A0A914YHC3_9BILA